MSSDENSSERAAFNMALSSLERLNKMLIEIKQFSCMGNQRMKYQMVLQFHIQSTPLVKKTSGKDRMKELKDELRNLVPKRIRYVDRQGNTTRFEDVFSQDLDFKLDDVLEKIQNLLQDEGYFMPSSEVEDLY